MTVFVSCISYPMSTIFTTTIIWLVQFQTACSGYGTLLQPSLALQPSMPSVTRVESTRSLRVELNPGSGLICQAKLDSWVWFLGSSHKFKSGPALKTRLVVIMPTWLLLPARSNIAMRLWFLLSCLIFHLSSLALIPFPFDSILDWSSLIMIII